MWGGLINHVFPNFLIIFGTLFLICFLFVTPHTPLTPLTPSPPSLPKVMAMMAKLDIKPDSSFFCKNPNGKCFFDFYDKEARDGAQRKLAAAAKSNKKFSHIRTYAVRKVTLHRHTRRRGYSTVAIMRARGEVCMARDTASYWHFIRLTRSGVPQDVLQDCIKQHQLCFKVLFFFICFVSSISKIF